MFTLRQIRAVFPTAYIAVPFVQGENTPYGRAYKAFVVEFSQRWTHTNDDDDTTPATERFVDCSLIITSGTRTTRPIESCIAERVTPSISAKGVRRVAPVVPSPSYRAVNATLLDRRTNAVHFLGSATGGDCVTGWSTYIEGTARIAGEENPVIVPDCLLALATIVDEALQKIDLEGAPRPAAWVAFAHGPENALSPLAWSALEAVENLGALRRSEERLIARFARDAAQNAESKKLAHA